MARALVEPTTLPVKIRKMLRAQCDNEWDRVTVDDDGSYLVHNNALQARKFVFGPSPLQQPEGGSFNGRTPGFSPADAGSSPVPSTPVALADAVTDLDTKPQRTRWQPPPERPLPVTEDKPKPKPKRQPARRRKEPDPEVRALASLIGSKAPEQGGVTIVPATAVPEAARPKGDPRDQVLVDEAIGVAPDWASVDVGIAAFKLSELCRNGLPDGIAFTVSPEVLALYGMDMELVGSAVRHPERVEVRPETAKKKYPILAFHRGDITTILGMRLPKSPQIIAAYAQSRLEPDGYLMPRSNSGGGGARKAQGLPKNPRQVIGQLRAAGAMVDEDAMAAGEKQAEVTFRDQQLGKISIDANTPRATSESDYQRMLRKINGIKERHGAAV